jgi:hypothetical protein
MEWKQEGMAETVLKELAVGPDSRAKNDYFRQTVHQQDVVRELVKGGVSSHIGFVGCIIYETHTIQKLPNAQKSSRSRCRMLPFTTDSNILALAWDWNRPHWLPRLSWHWPKPYIFVWEGLLLSLSERERPKLSKLWAPNWFDLYLFSSVTKNLTCMRWVAFWVVFTKLEHGVVSTSSTNWKKKFCRQCRCKFLGGIQPGQCLPYRFVGRSIRLDPNMATFTTMNPVFARPFVISQRTDSLVYGKDIMDLARTIMIVNF